MELSFTSEQVALCDQVHAWIQNAMPAASEAKAEMATGGTWVPQRAVPLHGGIARIGQHDEQHDAGLNFERTHALGTLFGDEEHQLARGVSLPTFTAGVRA